MKKETLDLLFAENLPRQSGICRISSAIETENYGKDQKDGSLDVEKQDQGFSSSTPIKSSKKAYEVLKDKIEEVVTSIDEGYGKLDKSTIIKVLEGLTLQFKKELEEQNGAKDFESKLKNELDQ